MRCVQATKQQCWCPEDDSALPGGRTWQKERNDLAEAKRVKTAAPNRTDGRTVIKELSRRRKRVCLKEIDPYICNILQICSFKDVEKLVAPDIEYQKS